MSKTLSWWRDKRLNHLCGGSWKATFSQFDFSDQAGVLISSHCQIPDGSLQKSFKCILYLKKNKKKVRNQSNRLGQLNNFSQQNCESPKCLLTVNINSCHGNVIKPNIKHLFNTEMHIFLTKCLQADFCFRSLAFCTVSVGYFWHSYLCVEREDTGAPPRVIKNQQGPGSRPKPSFVCTWTDSNSIPSDINIYKNQCVSSDSNCAPNATSLCSVVYIAADCLRYDWARRIIRIACILISYRPVIIIILLYFFPGCQQKWSCSSASIANNVYFVYFGELHYKPSK